MPSLEVFDIIDKVIMSKTDNNESFTAYDVTKAARLETDEEFYHGEVKDYIHDKMDNDSDYTKEINGLWGAWEYKPDPAKTAPIQNIHGDNQQHTPKSFTTNINDLVTKVKQKINNITRPILPECIIFTRDNRNRLCIPNKITSKCGFYPKDLLCIRVEGNRLVLSSNKGERSILTIDKHNNIRISATRLREAGISPMDSVKIFIENGNIVLTK